MSDSPHEDPNVASAIPRAEQAEILSDSSDPDVLDAQAGLLTAQAKLVKAKTPLFDRIVMRGLIPIALAIVGPWALVTFNTEQQSQGTVITDLQKLLADAKTEAAARGERMRAQEEARAAELLSMSHMVCRLDDTLKMAVVQMAVSRALSQPPAAPMDPSVRTHLLPLPSKRSVIRDVSNQVQIPGLDAEEIQKLAGEQYDRMIGQRRR